MVGGRYFTLVDRHNGAMKGEVSGEGGEDRKKHETHDRRPTPQPLTTRPSTIVQKPKVNVWMTPPMLKMTAPTKSVPFRPMISPIRPAAIEVTVGHSLKVIFRAGRDEGAHRKHQFRGRRPSFQPEARLVEQRNY